MPAVLLWTHLSGGLIANNKLLGMEGNRRFDDRIVAGPFFICGDNGEDFCSLSDEQCEKYVREFAQPHEIIQDEVEQDMGITIIGL